MPASLLAKYKEYRYTPAIFFTGSTECVKMLEEQDVQSIIN